jgi:NADP-dependent 3-hydroxy acid dehydrogenase YdfG
VIVITGGTSDIGEATVRLCVEEGARVIFSGRSEEASVSLVAALGPNTRLVRTDVTREANIKGTIDAAVATFGRLDCLCNNAGRPTHGGIEDVTVDELHYAMDLF